MTTTTVAVRPELPHVGVTSTAVGPREKPEGRPQPQRGTMTDFDRYLARAQAIGYQPGIAAATFERLKLVIAQSKILVYDSEAVDQWMLKKIKEERKRTPNLTWFWKALNAPALRLRTNIHSSLDTLRYQHGRWRSGMSANTGMVDFDQCYDKIIPDAVLATAETILQSFKKEDPIVLLVTDYAVVLPDPFLAAAVPGYPFLIVDFWDEPGFQPEAASGQNLE